MSTLGQAWFCAVQLALGVAAVGCGGKTSTSSMETPATGATPATSQPAGGMVAAASAGSSAGGTTARAGQDARPAAAGGGGSTAATAGAAGVTNPPAGSGGSSVPPSAGSVADAGVSDASAGDASVPAGDDDLCQVGVANGAQPTRLQLSGNTFAHDPTMIEADGVYYRFWTGERIPMATSRDLMSWSDGPAVYRNGYPDWSDEWLRGVSGQTFNFPWAPDVSYFGGKYHIYSSFSAKFGDNISCITHLTTDDIASGNWTDHGPVICTEGNEPYNAIDADVGFDDAGKAYLSFGSFWDGIMAFPLDSEGAREGDELTRLAWAREIEAPVLFKRCGHYYLFVSHGLCCPGQGRSVEQLSYRVLVGRSDNVLGPYMDREGKALIDGGGTLIVEGDDTFAAAGHSDVIVAEGKIYNLYHAYRRPRGSAELRVTELLFDEEGWPVPHAP
jgi:arabinan endo-1,5-alpha-L-arabinosidase